jgi:hypothetical protein
VRRERISRRGRQEVACRSIEALCSGSPEHQLSPSVRGLDGPAVGGFPSGDRGTDQGRPRPARRRPRPRQEKCREQPPSVTQGPHRAGRCRRRCRRPCGRARETSRRTFAWSCGIRRRTGSGGTMPGGGRSMPRGGADDVPPDVISAISSAGESTPSALQKLTCVDDGDGFVVAAAQVDRPADQLAGAEVDDRVKVDPTVLRGSHLGHVDMPQIVRADDPEQPRPPAPVTVAGPLQQPVRAGTTGRRTATTQTTGTAGFPGAWTGPAGVAVRSRGGRGAAGTAASSWSR